jgi:hypothetical protein
MLFEDRKQIEILSVDALANSLIVKRHQLREQYARKVSRRILAIFRHRASLLQSVQQAKDLYELLTGPELEKLIRRYQVDASHVELCKALVRKATTGMFAPKNVELELGAKPVEKLPPLKDELRGRSSVSLTLADLEADKTSTFMPLRSKQELGPVVTKQAPKPRIVFSLRDLGQI